MNLQMALKDQVSELTVFQKFQSLEEQAFPINNLMFNWK